MSELKPCPFCGSTHTNISNRHTDHYQAHCMTCGADGPCGVRMDIAIAAWNARPVEDALRAENEALREALGEAVARIDDMLSADDGQAFKEARKALPTIRAALEGKASI